MTLPKYFRPMSVVGGLAIAILVALVAASSGSSAAPPAKASPAQQADSVVFDLQFARSYTETGAVEALGQVVYCGVDTFAEPFRLDVLVTSPPNLSDPEDGTSAYLPNHDGAGWLDVKLQAASGAEAQEAYRVPANDSLAFGLNLGGRPGEDQMVRVTSLPLGDQDGRGRGFHGVASVLAQAGATDPFLGDGRTDNYCVSIGVEPNPGQVSLPGEYLEGQISVTMHVPDDWVHDGDGSDGGVLAGFPH